MGTYLLAINDLGSRDNDGTEEVEVKTHTLTQILWKGRGFGLVGVRRETFEQTCREIPVPPEG